MSLRSTDIFSLVQSVKVLIKTKIIIIPAILYALGLDKKKLNVVLSSSNTNICVCSFQQHNLWKVVFLSLQKIQDLWELQNAKYWLVPKAGKTALEKQVLFESCTQGLAELCQFTHNKLPRFTIKLYSPKWSGLDGAGNCH